MKTVWLNALLQTAYILASSSMTARPTGTNTLWWVLLSYPWLICWSAVAIMGFLPRNRKHWKIYGVSGLAPILGLFLGGCVGQRLANQNFQRDSIYLKQVVAQIARTSSLTDVGEIPLPNKNGSKYWYGWARRSPDHTLSVVFIVSGGIGISSFGYLYQSQGSTPADLAERNWKWRPLENHWFEVSR